VRNVLGCASFLIVSGRVLLSDVSSPPREVWTPAADDDQRDGRDSPRRTGSARAVAPRTKIGRSSPRNRRRPARRHRPARRPPPAPAARSRPSAPGYSPALHGPPTGKKTRQAGERPRRGRARRIRADGTISGPAAGHRDQAQPPAPAGTRRAHLCTLPALQCNV